jgi:hypothetical protein
MLGQGYSGMLGQEAPSEVTDAVGDFIGPEAAPTSVTSSGFHC